MICHPCHCHQYPTTTTTIIVIIIIATVIIAIGSIDVLMSLIVLLPKFFNKLLMEAASTT